MKSLLRCVFLAAVAMGVSLSASAGELTFHLQNGRVTIIAKEVPVREILQEWARAGQTNILNLDRLAGPPITLHIIDATESEALDTLLRSTAGYMAAPRAVALVNASVYDRIMILPTSRAPLSAASTAPPTFRPAPPPAPVDDDDEPVPMGVPGPQPAQMPASPVVSPFPGLQPQPLGAQQPGQAAPVMTAPRPGALPQPQSPNGVPNPYQPTVVRPAGGPGGPGSPTGRPGGPGGA